MLGYLRNNFYLPSTNLELLLCKTFVCTKLKNAASILECPALSRQDLRHWRCESHSICFTLSNYHRTSSVTSKETTLFLPNLAMRCQFPDFVYFTKYITIQSQKKNMYHLPITFYHIVIINIVHASQCPTNTFYNSLMPKTCHHQNHLPLSIAMLENSLQENG